MPQTKSPYADWKAPGADSAYLLWPQANKIIDDVQANRKSLDNSRAQLSGIELTEIRRRQRRELGIDENQPIIATGHQTELYHPGVWAKLALLHSASPRLGAASAHFAVDTDVPKHLNLRFPGFNQAITDDSRLTNAAWSGLLNCPDADYVQEMSALIRASVRSWKFQPMVLDFLSEFARRCTAGQSLSPALCDSMSAIDRSLGLNHRTIVLSSLLDSQPYLVLLHHLLSRPIEFAGAYNNALRQYRQQHRLRTEAKPMPNLHVGDDHCEAAFWLDDLSSARRERAMVHRLGADWMLSVEGKTFHLETSGNGWDSARRLGEFLKSHELRLAPRAMTLMLYVRLIAVDYFVHGIGGGRYDQVTDQVIREFFGIEPPAFGVTTATLLFPQALNHELPCLPCLAHRGHRLRHQVLGEAKMRMVGQIAELPRCSPQRREIFGEMHDRLKSAVSSSAAIQDWDIRWQQANEQVASLSPLFDREFFYAVQPRERLTHLIDLYKAEFDLIGDKSISRRDAEAQRDE